MKKKTKPPRTIDGVWKECLRMWAWIDRHRDEDEVDDLKEKWLEKNYGEDVFIENDCFFCEKAEFCDVWDGECSEGKSDCPGAKIDPNFRCETKSHHWSKKPHEFYLKLKQLNRKRLKSKVKK